MKPVATISFNDADSNGQGTAIVRARDGVVAVTLSLRTNGDLEVFLPVESALEFSAALRQAVELAGRGA